MWNGTKYVYNMMRSTAEPWLAEFLLVVSRCSLHLGFLTLQLPERTRQHGIPVKELNEENEFNWLHTINRQVDGNGAAILSYNYTYFHFQCREVCRSISLNMGCLWLTSVHRSTFLDSGGNGRVVSCRTNRRRRLCMSKTGMNKICFPSNSAGWSPPSSSSSTHSWSQPFIFQIKIQFWLLKRTHSAHFIFIFVYFHRQRGPLGARMCVWMCGRVYICAPRVQFKY